MFGVALCWAYSGVIRGLMADWTHDPNYSHGLLVIVAAAYLIWLQRDTLATLPPQPSRGGLVLVTIGLLALLAGTAGLEFFVTRISLPIVLAGSVWFLWGRRHLHAVAFPLVLLVLAIPLPAIVFNQIAFPLQLLASRVGVAALHALDIPVLREGNVIVLASTKLEVAEACSGIRSLVSLVTLALLLGSMTQVRPVSRVLIACSAIPIAVVTNGLRVAATGIAAHYAGPDAASGALHSVSGWLVFAVSLALVIVVDRVVGLVFRPVRTLELEGV